jgi:predicted dehydrogenase
MKPAQHSVVVVGTGSIGRRHIQNLLSIGIKDVTVVDKNRAALEDLCDEYDLTGYTSLDAALDEYPDIAVVATPTSYHVEHARTAAEHGCHLFVEKPLSHDRHSIETLLRIVDEQDLVTLVGCNLRFHPEIRKIYDLLQEGTIGPIISARIEGGSYLPGWFPDSDYSDAYSAREDLGGGVILDYIHELNYARWFFGEFDTVTALAGQRTSLDVETNDVAGILAETRGGILCEFHLDYIQREYSRSAHIIGEGGTIRWSWEDERVEWYVAETDERRSFERPTDWSPNDMYVDEMEHFLSCVANSAETICPVFCGERDLAVALAARESARTERHVSLSEPTE